MLTRKNEEWSVDCWVQSEILIYEISNWFLSLEVMFFLIFDTVDAIILYYQGGFVTGGLRATIPKERKWVEKFTKIHTFNGVSSTIIRKQNVLRAWNGAVIHSSSYFFHWGSCQINASCVVLLLYMYSYECISWSSFPLVIRHKTGFWNIFFVHFVQFMQSISMSKSNSSRLTWFSAKRINKL